MFAKLKDLTFLILTLGLLTACGGKPVTLTEIPEHSFPEELSATDEDGSVISMKLVGYCRSKLDGERKRLEIGIYQNSEQPDVANIRIQRAHYRLVGVFSYSSSVAVLDDLRNLDFNFEPSKEVSLLYAADSKSLDEDSLSLGAPGQEALQMWRAPENYGNELTGQAYLPEHWDDKALLDCGVLDSELEFANSHPQPSSLFLF